MSLHLVSCFNQKTKKLEHFSVPHSVYVYVMQLEQAIIHPDKTGLKKLYPDRFPTIKFDEEPWPRDDR